ncbi:MAG: hypothetical protein Q9O24_10320 [Gammaproteobacteria bacterium]|nr:hypothetical protein [Gammaproteobacteria bacterium]
MRFLLLLWLFWLSPLMAEGLLLVEKEAKIVQLLPDVGGDKRFEASGLTVVAEQAYVVFDNRPAVAQLSISLSKVASNHLLDGETSGVGYEALSFDPAEKRFYLLQESLKRDAGFFAKLSSGTLLNDTELQSQWLDFELPSGNKGLEGLAFFSRGGAEYLLALCEGNRCTSGKKGRKAGKGRLLLFAKRAGRWSFERKIKLPKSLRFVDYSGLAVQDNRIAITSQASSRLWVGRLKKRSWSLKGDGEVYRLPTNAAGERLYCNIEGVAWLSKSRLLLVSDRRKKSKQNRRCKAKDQSIHLVRLPN